MNCLEYTLSIQKHFQPIQASLVFKCPAVTHQQTIIPAALSVSVNAVCSSQCIQYHQLFFVSLFAITHCAIGSVNMVHAQNQLTYSIPIITYHDTIMIMSLQLTPIKLGILHLGTPLIKDLGIHLVSLLFYAIPKFPLFWGKHFITSLFIFSYKSKQLYLGFLFKFHGDFISPSSITAV